MAQGVAWGARERGVPCTVVVPDNAPQTKLDAIERLGGRIVPVPFEDWWRAIETSQHPGAEGYFVHPVLDDGVMAGNGTIGLEILEDLPDVDAVLVPWGGGGLTCGIASALRQAKPRHARDRRRARDRGAPRPPRCRARESRAVDYSASFVDGSGSRALLPKMWGLAQELVDGARRRSRSTRPPRRCGCWPSARASWPRAPARSRWQPPARATAAPARSSASSPAATSTARAWRRSWPARRPA